MNKNIYYLVRWMYNDKDFFLLWYDGGANPDGYVLRNQKEPTLLITRTKNEITEYAQKYGFRLSPQGESVLDFNELSKALKRLRPNRHLSQKMSEVFLNFWNTLDDISSSTKIQLISQDLFHKEDLDRLYEKLFYGNNLPPVTPEGSEYFPILVDKEQGIIRNFFRHAIKTISTMIDIGLEKNGEFI